LEQNKKKGWGHKKKTTTLNRVSNIHPDNTKRKAQSRNSENLQEAAGKIIRAGSSV
jgi:hypothetical protein